jgi:hypothetical protein
MDVEGHIERLTPSSVYTGHALTSNPGIPALLSHLVRFDIYRASRGLLQLLPFPMGRGDLNWLSG